MIDVSFVRESLRRHRGLAAVALIPISGILGYIVALHLEPPETNIVLDKPTITEYANQADGAYTIMYQTTGPIISSFEKDCIHGKGNLGGYYCGIMFSYDGNPGIIELRIPTGLMNEIDPVGEAVVLGFHLSWFPGQIPFQVISQDDHYTVFRIDAPRFHDMLFPDYRKIELRSGGYNSLAMTFFLSAIIFIFTLLAILLYTHEDREFKGIIRI